MRIVTAFILCAFLTLPASAQQPGVKIVTGADIASLMAKQPKDQNTFNPFIELAPFTLNLEHRVKGQGAAVHEKEAELFYVIDGSGTLLTGGKLVDEKRTNDANLSGSGIQGGTSNVVHKGDWFIVPEGVPHQFPSTDGTLTLMSLHLPRK